MRQVPPSRRAKTIMRPFFHQNGDPSISGSFESGIALPSALMVQMSKPDRFSPAGSTNQINVIDAYATILSLDQATLPTTNSAPVRLAILDANNDGNRRSLTTEYKAH